MKELFSAQNIGIACGAGLLAYCLYFDHKRINAPDYRDKVKAKREQERKKKEESDLIELPSPGDKEALERFFIKQIEAGEELMQAGEMDRALRHFGYAIAMCPQPQQLTAYLRQTLPTNGFSKLMEEIAIATEKVNEVYNM